MGSPPLGLTPPSSQLPLDLPLPHAAATTTPPLEVEQEQQEDGSLPTPSTAQSSGGPPKQYIILQKKVSTIATVDLPFPYGARCAVYSVVLVAGLAGLSRDDVHLCPARRRLLRLPQRLELQPPLRLRRGGLPRAAALVPEEAEDHAREDDEQRAQRTHDAADAEGCLHPCRGRERDGRGGGEGGVEGLRDGEGVGARGWDRAAAALHLHLPRRGSTCCRRVEHRIDRLRLVEKGHQGEGEPIGPEHPAVGVKLAAARRAQRAVRDAKVRQGLAIACLLCAGVGAALSVVAVASSATAELKMRREGDRARQIHKATIVSITYAPSSAVRSSAVWPYIPLLLLLVLATGLLSVPGWSGLTEGSAAAARRRQQRKEAAAAHGPYEDEDGEEEDDYKETEMDTSVISYAA